MRVNRALEAIVIFVGVSRFLYRTTFLSVRLAYGALDQLSLASVVIPPE